jgi:hypothetical protein
VGGNGDQSPGSWVSPFYIRIHLAHQGSSEDRRGVVRWLCAIPTQELASPPPASHAPAHPLPVSAGATSRMFGAQSTRLYLRALSRPLAASLQPGALQLTGPSLSTAAAAAAKPPPPVFKPKLQLPGACALPSWTMAMTAD